MLNLKIMKGFTLIETIVAVAVFVLLIAAVSGLIVTLYKVHNFGWQQSVAIDEARRGIETMVKEIREAKPGDDGSYPIEKAGDKEFIFYSDIDQDDQVERVRYFLGGASSGKQTKECVVFTKGGSCDVVFSGFLQGALQSAEVKISVEGDFGRSSEYAELYADGGYLDKICQNGCSDCAGAWQGTLIFDATAQAEDNYIQFSSDARSRVDPFCDWQEPNHAMKVIFELSWDEEIAGKDHYFQKGVINPTSSPVEYPLDQEKISLISSYVRNAPPIFKYFYFDEGEGLLKEITQYPARLVDTELIKLLLVVNVDPNRSPQDFELESSVQLRNLKK